MHSNLKKFRSMPQCLGNDSLLSSFGLGMLMTLRHALVKYGGGVIQMSGSIAGNTFARNRYGNYVRARTKPVNPNTPLQQEVRNALAQLTTRWASTLTAVQRTSWNLYASSVAMKNRLGETVFLTGSNHYIRSNTIRIRAGLAIVDDGPTTFELPQSDGTFAIAPTEAGGTISVTFDNSLPWANETGAFLFTFQGYPQNAQRNFFDGPWNYMEKIVGDDSVPPVVPSVQSAVIIMTEGQKQWVYARIALKDGRLSQPFRTTAFISA